MGKEKIQFPQNVSQLNRFWMSANLLRLKHINFPVPIIVPPIIAKYMQEVVDSVQTATEHFLWIFSKRNFLGELSMKSTCVNHTLMGK